MGPSNQSGHSSQGQTGKTPGFPRRFGKYTLLSHLATGGMADVFLARHLGPAGFEKECVIKRILPHLAQDQHNDSFIDMFLDEARIAARLSHPNIVHIFDVGQVDGDYFLALEYVDGITIEDMLDRTREQGQPALPWPIAARIVSNVAEGLEHAHKAKDSGDNPLMLVHRDISPSNIMVSWDGVAKVLDFGIAKAMSSGGPKVKTGVGIIKGKVPYMSPEQIQGLDLDGRSDVFSLGVVLYEMTTGQRPFPGDTTGQLTVQITSREPSSPELINPAFPRDLWPVLLRALSKNVDERYQSARDFKLDLEQFLADQLVTCTNYDVEAYLRELVPKRPRRELPSPEEIARVEAEVEDEAAAAATMPITPMAGTQSQSGRHAGRRENSLAPTSSTSAPSRTSGRELEELTNSGRRALQDPAADPSNDALDAENAAEQRRHRQSSSSGLIMAAIAILVVATGVIFYVLRQRAVQDAGNVATQGDKSVPPLPPTIPPTVTPPPATASGTAPTAANPTTPDKPATTPDKPAAPVKPASENAPTGEKKAATTPDKPATTPDKPEKSDKPEAVAKADDSGEEKPKPRRRIKKHDDEEPKDISSKLPLPPPPPPEP